jgi:hypothetical protein
MVVVSPNNHVVMPHPEPVFLVNLTLTALPLLLTVTLMVFASIAVPGDHPPPPTVESSMVHLTLLEGI